MDQAHEHAHNVAGTLGAVFIGGFVAAIFSGVASVQCLVYFKFYPMDHAAIKSLVLSVWFLDIFHTTCIGIALWSYMIHHFGHAEQIDYIHWSLALTIVVTAILTFLVQCFFVHRIYRLSKQKVYIAGPLGLIAFCRLFFASLTTVKLIHLKTLSAFVAQYKWSFTCGLAFSSSLDILTTVFLCYFLMDGRKQTTSLTHIVDKLMLYAFECGSLTCVAAIISMICWLVMPKNLIFMGVHLIIGKLYTNSLLATLNTRLELQTLPNNPKRRSFTTKATEMDKTTVSSRHLSMRHSRMSKGAFMSGPPLRINVEESVIRTIDESAFSASTIVVPTSRDRFSSTLAEKMFLHTAAAGDEEALSHFPPSPSATESLTQISAISDECASNAV